MWSSSSSGSVLLTTILFFITTALADKGDHTIANQTMVDGALFDKYQFLSPGIFMGFLVGFLLLTILYVGISALTSLEITHAAFEKESGPAQAKKQN